MNTAAGQVKPNKGVIDKTILPLVDKSDIFSIIVANNPNATPATNVTTAPPNVITSPTANCNRPHDSVIMLFMKSVRVPSPKNTFHIPFSPVQIVWIAGNIKLTDVDKVSGALVYNESTNKLNFWNGSAWEAVTSS